MGKHYHHSSGHKSRVAERNHTIRRAKERYGVDLSRDDGYARLNDRAFRYFELNEPSHGIEFVTDQHDAKVFWLWYRNQAMLSLWSPRTKQITTFMSTASYWPKRSRYKGRRWVNEGLHRWTRTIPMNTMETPPELEPIPPMNRS